jgi:tRNA threonylcarbamoyladenosine biosynthesis protein TsaE
VSGELGTGKTTFVRGAARALGVSAPVTSPTFTIGRRYAGRVPVAHLDLYRLEGLDGEDPALLEDYLDPGAVAFVEWPERAGAAVPAATVRVRIEHLGGDRRRITVT